MNMGSVFIRFKKTFVTKITNLELEMDARFTVQCISRPLPFGYADQGWYSNVWLFSIVNMQYSYSGLL